MSNQIPQGERCDSKDLCPCFDSLTYWCQLYDETVDPHGKRLPICLQRKPRIVEVEQPSTDGK
jgi:hypothetical protein